MMQMRFRVGLATAFSVLTLAASTPALARQSQPMTQNAIAALSTHRPSILAMGRVDAVFPDGVQVLGQKFFLATGPIVAVGDYVAVIGQISAQGVTSAHALVGIAEQYVPGASLTFLKAPIGVTNKALLRASVGAAEVDFVPVLAGGSIDLATGTVVEVLGTQPVIGGVVLAQSLVTGGLARAATDGSLGTGRNGSLGTGRNGSLGTGRNGSLGTGNNGSLGTGSLKATTDGSLGTGSNGSLGTGRNGSLGTGKNGSLGTGQQ